MTRGRNRLEQLRGPDFFIVGQPKTGTTALCEMLRQHPQIFIPDLKEPMFFDTDLRMRFVPVGVGAPLETLEDYLALFAEADPRQRVGEASTSYLRSNVAARSIGDFNPRARVVAILREPASLLRSVHLQAVQDRFETVKDLRRALALEKKRRRGRSVPRGSHRPQMLLYSEHVRYVEQLERYHSVFPREQVLVLIYDDFRRDNSATVQRVQDFLGVDSFSVRSVEANPTVLLRSRAITNAVQRISVGYGPASRAVKGAVKTVTRRRFRRRLLRRAYGGLVFTEPPAPDEELMAELRQRFAPEVYRLSEHLGRDLVALWGYNDA